MTRNEAFDVLEKQGVAEVRVEFSGGNDEGGVENIALLNKEGNTVRELQEWYNSSVWNPETRQYESQHPPNLDEELSKVLCKPVYDKYHSFAGEFYVSGIVVWNVGNRSVKMDGREQVRHWEEFEDECE